MRRLMSSEVLACMVLIALLGCGNKVEQCNQVVQLVNTHVAKTAQFQTINPNDSQALATGMAQVAAATNSFSTQLNGLTLSDEKIVAFRTEYQKHLFSSAGYAQQMAGLVQSVIPFEQGMSANQKKIEALVNQISTTCSTQKATQEVCPKLGKSINGVLDGLNKDDFQNKSLQELKAMPFSDATLKPIVDEFVLLAGQMSSSRQQYKKTKADILKLVVELEKADAQDSSLVANFNAHCQSLSGRGTKERARESGLGTGQGRS